MAFWDKHLFGRWVPSATDCQSRHLDLPDSAGWICRDMSTIHLDWEMIVKHSWRNPPQKPNAVGEKCKKDLRNWETSLKKSWGNLLQNLLAAKDGSAPKDQRHHDGSAPQNHREYESNSAPEPLLWLKTPKLLLFGKNTTHRSRRMNMNEYSQCQNAHIYAKNIFKESSWFPEVHGFHLHDDS